MASALSRLRAVILSEPSAWAVQNMVGVFVATLFVTVPGLRFPLACMVPVIVPLVLLLGPDRSVGGRILASGVMCSCSVAGAVMGGCVVSLAFLARGEGEPLMAFLPGELARVAYPTEAVAQLQQRLAQQAVTDLPPALLQQLSILKADLERWLDTPPFAAAFWALLIVLSAALFAPLALACAYAPGTQALFVQIAALMAGNVVVCSLLAQALTLDMFWREVVLGFVYSGLATALCSLAAGCLLCVRSAHDEARRAAAAILLEGGSHISRMASTLLQPRGCAPAAAAAEAEAEAALETDGLIGAASGTKAGGDASAEEARFRCHLARLTGEGGSAPGTGGGGPAAGRPGAPPAAARAEFQRQWARLKRSLGMAAFEPPIPGLCSQPGASAALYGRLQSELELLFGAVFALAAACNRGSLEELGGGASVAAAGDAFARVRGALAGALATAAGACAACGGALAHMPLGRPCSGPALPWRPVDPACWAALQEELVGGASALAAFYNTGRAELGLDFALEMDRDKRNALLCIMPAAVQLLYCLESVEAAAAAALGVTIPAVTQRPSRDVENGGKCVADGGDGSSGAAAAPPPAAPGLAQRMRPYIANATTLLALLSSAAAWVAIAKGVATACRGHPAAPSFRAGLRSALGRPAPQFAVKWWLGNSLAMMGSLLFIWKGPSQESLSAEMEQFNNWKPLYFTMATVLILQPNVEISADRGVLRILGIGLGGLLGLAAGCNASLLASPFYFTGILLLGAAAFSLPAVVPEFRFSLAMACYTFTGILACTYLGCCGAVVTWQDVGAKAVPTALGALWAWALTALVLPRYASNAMLAQQAGILRDTFCVLRSEHDEVVAAARERRAPALGPCFAELSDQGARIAAVGAQLGAAAVDPRQHTLLSPSLSPPPVVHLMQARLLSLAGHTWASLCTVARPAWRGGGGGGGKAAGAAQPQAASLAAGDYFRIIAEHEGLARSLQTMMDAQQALVEACAEDLEQGRHPAGVAQLRRRVAAALAAAADARLAHHLQYHREHRPQLLAQLAGTPCRLPDLVFSGWMASFGACLDELLVLGRALASPPAQQRDWLGSWLTAWRHTRTQ